jgi:hypothetical protein
VTEPARFQVLGIDPGGTTGLASYNQKMWDVRQLPANEVPAYVRQWIDWPVPEDLHVVCERFVPSARALSFQPDALELIGYVRYLCQEKGISFSLQSPASAKKIAPNPLLKTVGAYRQSTPHGLDAARHVALWMFINQPDILRVLKQGVV